MGGNLAVCVQSSSGCGGAGCAFGCNSRGPSAGFDCQCPKGHQAVTGSQGQVSHCVALNSVDNFLENTNNDVSDVISSEGCFACQMNKPPKNSRSSSSTSIQQRNRKGKSRSSYTRRSRNYHYSSQRKILKRRTRRNTFNATFTSIRPLPFALKSSETFKNSTQETRKYTKMTIRLQYEQTKHKRPILFIVPARTASTVLDYTIHGKNKDLFGLRHDPDGFLALFYLKKVTPISGNSVIHHVRVLGEHTQSITSASTISTSRHQASNKKELNMKVKLVVGKIM